MDIRNEIREMSRRLPIVDDVLAAIDSGSLFQRGMKFTLFIAAVLGGLAGLYAYVVGGFSALFEGHLSAEIRIGAFLAALIGAGGALAGALVLYRRAQGIREDMNVSEVSLQILRTVVELVALGVVVYGVATGVAYIIAGSRGHWAGIVGLVGQPAEALDDFSDAFTGGDSWLLSRLFGVVITALSALGGFLALFFGYQVWEIYRIFYRFFARRD